MKRTIVPGRSYSVAVVIADESNPLAAPGAANGLVVQAVLSDAPGGAAIDPACVYAGDAGAVAPAGYTGTLYLVQIVGATTSAPLATRDDAPLFLNVRANGELVEVIELVVSNE